MFKNKKNIGKMDSRIRGNDKKAFTLMELMVSIAILWIISSAVFTVISTLFYDWKKDKMRIEMNAEIVDSVAMVEKYIKEASELKILDSNVWDWNILWNKLNWILVKNKNSDIKSSLFTLIKPLQKDLSWDFWEKTVWDKNFHLWITELNLFSDISKDSNGNLYYSDPWNWFVWKKDSSWVLSKISSFQYDWKELKFLTPTWLLIWNTNIYFSDTYRNLIFYVPKTHFANDKVKILVWKIWEKINQDTWVKSNYVISWYQDWSSWIATLNHPKWLALSDNKLYFADSWNNVIRFIDLSTNNVETFIWNWKAWISEDWVFHQEYLLNNPTDIDIRDDIWIILISDTNNNRIVATWPASWNNSYSKPFTIAWVWKREFKNLSSWFFNLDDKFVWSKDEVIKEEKNIWKMWFWWDFFLANNAILNHPTWVKFFWTWWFIFSDSWNNLIRKVSIWDFWDWATKTLFDNQNRIETIIWNSSEVLIKKWSWSLMDIKISTAAPKSWNKSWSWKLAFLDNPMWMSFSWSDILFTDLQIFKKKLYWKINLCNWDCLNWNWDVNFLKEKAFNALNLDKISITNLWDFISKTPLDLMQFTEKNFNNWTQKIISIYLKFIDFLKNDDGISVDIRTSVKNLIQN